MLVSSSVLQSKHNQVSITIIVNQQAVKFICQGKVRKCMQCCQERLFTIRQNTTAKCAGEEQFAKSNFICKLQQLYNNLQYNVFI